MRAELLGAVQSFLNTTPTSAKIASIELLRIAHRLKKITIPGERPILGELDAILGIRDRRKIKKETYAFFIVKSIDLLKPGGSYFLIRYAQEARAYSLLVLLISVSYYFFIRMVRRGETRGAAVGYAASTALLLYTHYHAAFIN